MTHSQIIIENIKDCIKSNKNQLLSYDHCKQHIFEVGGLSETLMKIYILIASQAKYFRGRCSIPDLYSLFPLLPFLRKNFYNFCWLKLKVIIFIVI
jgi:hypothetical protein